MEIAHHELVILKARLPETNPLSHGFILEYNGIIESAQSRTQRDLRRFLIDTNDVLPTSGEFVGTRTGPPQFPITRTNFLAKLNKALEDFGKYISK